MACRAAASMQPMTDAARTVINYLISTRDAYQHRPATDFRDVVVAQVAIFKADDIGAQAQSHRRDERD